MLEEQKSDEIARLPIFPLPNVVFFPGTLLSLHIFEPRYKQMVSDALREERRIGMALLRSGWEADYYENPEIYPIGVVGQIVDEQKLRGDEYNIQLSGHSRYKIVEMLQEKPYRVARVQLLQDRVPGPECVVRISRELISCFSEGSQGRLPPGSDIAVLEKLDFSTLVNSICSSLKLSVYEKQSLLELKDLKVRAETTLTVLKKWLGEKQFVAEFRHLKPEDPRVN